MHVLSESSKYRSLNNKSDLIKLIREYQENKYKVKDLQKYTREQLFFIFCKVESKYLKFQNGTSR